MSTDDTSRDALIERVATDLRASAWRYHHPDLPVPVLDRQRAARGRYWRAQATAVVDAVVLPLVEEWDRLTRDYETAHDAEFRAIRRAEAAEAERDTYRERRRQVMRDYEAVVKEREAAEAALEAVRGLVEDSRRTGRRLSALDVADALDEHGAPK